MILFFTDLDKDIKDVLREYQYYPDYVDHLRRIMKEFGVKEETMDDKTINTVEFIGNGREILELMKKALCEFKNVYVINAFLHPHHGLADTGRATLNILVNIPDEKKWIEITYRHHESPIEESGMEVYHIKNITIIENHFQKIRSNDQKMLTSYGATHHIQGNIY